MKTIAYRARRDDPAKRKFRIVRIAVRVPNDAAERIVETGRAHYSTKGAWRRSGRLRPSDIPAAERRAVFGDAL